MGYQTTKANVCEFVCVSVSVSVVVFTLDVGLECFLWVLGCLLMFQLVLLLYSELLVCFGGGCGL